MGKLRWIAVVYFVILLAAAALNYMPGLTDAEGRAFGIFALDIFDDLLHVASATWAGVAAAMGSRASRIFLRYFGLLYLADGALGLATGSGYLHRGCSFRSANPWHRESRCARLAAAIQDPREPATHWSRRIRGVCELQVQG